MARMAKMMMGVAYSVTGKLTLKIISLLQELMIIWYCIFDGSTIGSSALVATRRAAVNTWSYSASSRGSHSMPTVIL